MPAPLDPIYLADLDWAIAADYQGYGRDTAAIVAPGAKIVTDEFGADVLDLEVSCRRDLLANFLPRRGQLDPIHRALQYRSRTITHEADCWTKMNIQFNGFIDENERDEEPENSVNERTVTLRNGSELTIAVTYMAPTKLWMYALPNDPLSPRHNGELTVSLASFQITEIRTSADQNLTGAVTLTQLRNQGGYKFTTPVRNTVFTRKTTGGVCRITEQHEGLIVASF